MFVLISQNKASIPIKCSRYYIIQIIRCHGRHIYCLSDTKKIINQSKRLERVKSEGQTWEIWHFFSLLVLPFKCIFSPLIKVKEFGPEDHQINIFVIYFIINMLVVKTSTCITQLTLSLQSWLCLLCVNYITLRLDHMLLHNAYTITNSIRVIIPVRIYHVNCHQVWDWEVWGQNSVGYLEIPSLNRSAIKETLGGKSKKLASITDKQWDMFDKKTLSVIQLCLSEQIKKEKIFVRRSSSWSNKWNYCCSIITKLKSLYMKRVLQTIFVLKSAYILLTCMWVLQFDLILTSLIL